MASNINTAYLQYWEDFSSLGKSMNRYAIASFISMAAGFLGSIIIQFIFIMPMMGAIQSETFNDPYTMIIGMIGVMVFFLIVALALSIYQFVTYIQYLIQLKKVGEYTNDIDLQKVFKMEIWSWILSFIMIFIILPLMVAIFFMGGFMEDLLYEGDIYGFMLFFFGFIFLIFIVALVSIILQILSVVAFDRWGQNFNLANQQNPYTRNIAEGTNFMKWGRIITLFVGTIGMILYFVGFMKAGKNMVEFFDGYGNQQLSQGATFSQSSSSNTFQQPGSYTTNPSLNSSYMGNTSYGNTTMKPQSTGVCSFCGSKLDDKNSMFCSNCGRKLI